MPHLDAMALILLINTCTVLIWPAKQPATAQTHPANFRSFTVTPVCHSQMHTQGAGVPVATDHKNSTIISTLVHASWKLPVSCQHAAPLKSWHTKNAKLQAVQPVETSATADQRNLRHCMLWFKQLIKPDSKPPGTHAKQTEQPPATLLGTTHNEQCGSVISRKAHGIHFSNCKGDSTNLTYILQYMEYI